MIYFIVWAGKEGKVKKVHPGVYELLNCSIMTVIFLFIADYPLAFTTFPGTIQTPGYPWAYPSFTKYEYLIHAKPSEIVVITFTDFLLEAAHTTEADVIVLCERMGFVESDGLDECLEKIEKDELCGPSRDCYIPCIEDTAQDFVEVSQ